MPSSASEQFLIDFHNAHPGLTSKAFGQLPVKRGGLPMPSSYAALAEWVPVRGGPLKVLDLACGDGHLLSLLSARKQIGLGLIGLDISSAELDIARLRLGDDVALIEANARHMSIPDDALDYVLCHMALMLMDDSDQVLSEIHRVLKPGGTLAAVVGSRPPPSLAFSRYIQALSNYTRVPELKEIRFGDRRWGSETGIMELLAPRFSAVTIEEIQITQRLSPAELWLWFSDTYDLYLLSDVDRSSVKGDYLDALQPHCEPDGKFEYLESMRVFSARVATR